MSKKKDSNGTIELHYLKTKNYRTYYFDGLYGGITPNGKNIYMDIFLERNSTPQIMKHEVIDGTIGKIISKNGKDGIIREVECGLIMDIETARKLRNWLDAKIDEYDEFVNGD